MVDVRIQFFGSIRAAAQKAEDGVRLAEETTVLRLLEVLADTLGEEFRGEIWAGGDLREDLTVTVNGTIIKHEAADEIILRPDDVLALFPLFPGGG